MPINVLITGGCGFIGSALVNYLVAKYPSIRFINLDRLDYVASLKNITVNDASNYHFVQGDITKFDLVMSLLKLYEIDTIIHLAAQSSVDHSNSNSFQHVQDNIVGTYTMLEAALQYGKIQRFIHCSTDECYGDQEDGNPVDETSILMPNNIYSATKASAEMLVRAYRVSHKLPIIVSRGNNCVGERQFPEKVWPSFIMKLLRGEKVKVHGNGSARRNFMYVEDTVRAFEVLLFKGKIGEIYNLGTNNELSVLEVADILRQKICPNKQLDEIIEYVPDRPFNDTRYWIKSEKIRALGWKETIPFNEAIDRTIDWYRKNGETQWTTEKINN